MASLGGVKGSGESLAKQAWKDSSLQAFRLVFVSEGTRENNTETTLREEDGFEKHDLGKILLDGG